MIRGLRNAINKKYKVNELIGRGSYGCVSKAKEISSGRLVALKVMKN
jgi:serine/threonine protein kinase